MYKIQASGDRAFVWKMIALEEKRIHEQVRLISDSGGDAECTCSVTNAHPSKINSTGGSSWQHSSRC